MIKVILVGCGGKMGGFISQAIESAEDMQIVCGVDLIKSNAYDYDVVQKITDAPKNADVIIDFSNPDVCEEVADFAKMTKIPLVAGTTGLSEVQQKKIEDTSKSVALFSSFNMSLGINLLLELSKKAAAVLGNDFDVEIVEQHHNQKIDAPSGTAYMIASAINDVMDDKMQYVYDRHSTRGKRKKNEIGIHSVRGGTIVGEHEVIFAGKDEVIKISHSAYSKQVFAVGAVNAARFIYNKPAGLYSMKDIIK